MSVKKMNEINLDKVGEAGETVLATQDINDEVQIKYAILEFYQVANSINDNNRVDVLQKMANRCNVICSMAHVYLSKFNNQLIMDEYTNAMKEMFADVVDKDSKCDPYSVFLRTVETVGLFLGIRENLSEKISEQILSAMMNEEAESIKGGVIDG